MKSLVPVAALVWICCAFVACSEDEHSYVKNFIDGETTPTMSTTDVVTLISDSGYTRYRITTPLWLMYDEAAQPFWKFPGGIDLTQYDIDGSPSASLICDSATYLSQRRLWQLDGNVIMVNSLRDSFLTQQVFWDQRARKVYSDSFIHIVRTERIIEGYGFNSNEQMTEFSVNRPTAIIPLTRELGKKNASSSAATPVPVDDDADMDATDRYRRAPAPIRASERRSITGQPIMQTNNSL